MTGSDEIESKLKRTLAFVQGVIDAFPELLFESSADGRYLNAWTKNPEMLAASRESMLGRTLDEVLSPDSAAIAKAALQEADEAGLSFGKIITVETAVGRRSFELSVSKMPMGEGEPPHFVTVSRDVTARLDLQAELAQKERQFRTLVENSPDAIARFDPALRCLYANPALAGRAPTGTAVGADAGGLFGEAAGRELQARLAGVLGSGEPADFEMNWADAHGQAVCSLVHLTPEFDAQREIASVLLIGRDLTERKRAEAERQAREAAEAASRAKGEFLASVSHEIRTPLNAIIGMSYLALQGSLSHSQQRYIQTVHRSAESLLGIINDILDLSKIEAGKLDMERIDFDLGEVMDGLASLLGVRAEQKGLKLVFERSPRVPTRLVGDPSRLGQVLLNLGNNAVKFTERGEIVVGVHELERDDVSVRLRFEVRDSGIGISAQQQQLLFTPFAQGDASTSRRFGGTGLGLAISQRLVSLMGGTIEVDSAPGLGSCFGFSARLGLQAAHAAAPALDGQRDAIARARTAMRDETLQDNQSRLRGARVLLVEDNTVNQELARTLLGRAGIVVTVVEDGRQAVDILARESFDGVLMDCQMPVMDGYTATGILRSQPRLRELPIIAMTANAMVGDREKALAAGMNEQIGKPINVEEMFATLARWIRPRAPAAVQASGEPHASAAAPLPGIDGSTWVGHGMGDLALYRRLLGMFLQDQQSFPAPFMAALGSADTPTVRRLAHNLKSQAAMLGAHGVERAATALEAACAAQEPRHRLQALLDDLAGHLHPVLDGLRNAAALK